MTAAQQRAVRAAVRYGNALFRARKELRALDDIALCKRLGKYQGRTMGEVRTRYRNPYGSSVKSIDRRTVIDLIAGYEVPA